MFQNHEVKKTYWAVVDKRPSQPEERLEHYLLKNQKQNKSYPSNPNNKNAKKAALTYKYVSSIDNYHLLEIELETGRHHQIRAQLAAFGLKIKGDVKYGFKRANPDLSIHLHARYLEFIHPVKKELKKVEIPTPEDSVWNAF
jgi:23S rRNA pseudouridine1911/1915/1917 synthase